MEVNYLSRSAPPEAGVKRQTYQAISQQVAAAFLGISGWTMARLVRQGYIRAFYIPHPSIRRTKLILIRIEELNRFIVENDCTQGITRNRWINPFTVREVPIPLAARIVGVSPNTVTQARATGLLDLTPDGLRQYILYRREKELRKKVRIKYRDKIKRLSQQIRYLRKQLRQTLCRKCRKKPVGISVPRKKKYVTDPQLSSSVLRRQ